MHPGPRLSSSSNVGSHLSPTRPSLRPFYNPQHGISKRKYQPIARFSSECPFSSRLHHILSTSPYHTISGLRRPTRQTIRHTYRKIVRNFNNQDQTITISDPNTGRRVTVPTLNRNTKSKHCTHQKEEDF